MLPDQDIRQVSQAQGENLGCKHRHSQWRPIWGMIILPEKLRFACLVVGKFGINIPEMVVNSGEEW